MHTVRVVMRNDDNLLPERITETNAQFLADAELQECYDAVNEYDQRIESGETP